MTENLLLVTVDSLRADRLGCYDYERDTTPFLDELAAGGYTFDNAFAHACSTRPSFPSILTSTYPRMYGGFERVGNDRTLVSEALSAAEYHTAGFHSNPYLSGDFGYDRGWDQFVETEEDDSLFTRLRGYARDKLDDDGLLYRMLKAAYDRTERQAGIEIGSVYVRADDLTDRALSWVEEVADADGGHFLWVHYMDVHHPYVPPTRYQQVFRDEPISERRSIKLRRKMLQEPASVTDAEMAEICDLYDAEIRFTDAQMRRLVEGVREAWGETTVLFTADHGEEFRDHGRFSHYGTFYDEVVHVPLVLNDGSPVGTRHDEMVGLLDVSPTLLDYADVDTPNSYLGYSLRRIVDGEDWPREDVASSRYCRTNNWKFIRDRDNNGGALYDLQTDPEETTSVADEYPDQLADLQERVTVIRELIDDYDRKVDDVEMDGDIQERLQALGYTE